MSPPSLIFGAGFLGVDYTGPNEAEELLKFLLSKAVKRIDTARRYPAINQGESERLLGRTKAAEKGFTIDTKVKATATGLSDGEVAIRGGRGSLTKSAIETSVRDSFVALGVKKVCLVLFSLWSNDRCNLQVHLLYCHGPDEETPVEETAAAFDKLFREGKFSKV